MIKKYDGPKHIILFGHRKQHGKDTCCDLAELILRDKEISYCRTFFAKKLKQMAADKYDLDVDKMEFDEYKNSKPEHLNGKTVREVLIDIGNGERAKDPNCWVNYAYDEIFQSGSNIGLISDFRFPNEAKSIAKNNACVHKILVYRPDGKFVSDGADDQLPDLENESYWDHVIINEDKTENWKQSLKIKVAGVIDKCLGL